MVTIKDGCGCDPCGCDWKQKLKEAYSRAIQSVNKIGDETGRVYFPDGTGFVKVPLPTKEQFDSIAEIDGIKASVDNLNETVPALETQVTGVTGSLVSNVKVLNGTTAGKFKVRIEREKAALIDSNDYDLSKVNSIELIQGSGPAMVKAQLTLSDGTVLRSDDFLFTTESIGTDVYISSFTFKAGNVNGTISADIGLNNGTTLEANNFVVPTDPSVISTITDLQTRTEALEQNVTDINNKADLNNVNQVIIAKQIEVNDKVRFKTTAGEGNTFSLVGGSPTSPFSVLQEKEVLGVMGDYPIGSVAMLGTDGKPMNFTTGGEVWEEVDLSNWPTDWVEGDKVKITTKIRCSSDGTLLLALWSSIIEFILTDNMSASALLNVSYDGFYTMTIYSPSSLNTPSDTALVFLRRPQGDLSNSQSFAIKVNEISTYAENLKIWRLKK